MTTQQSDCWIQDDVVPNAIDAERAPRLWDLSERLCDK
jgi:hypothetical protein